MRRTPLSAVPFFAVLLAGFLGVLLRAPQTVSAAERRTLRQFPAPSVSTVFSGAWMDQLESWLPDQFPAREPLRQLGMRVRTRGFGMLDYRGVYVSNGSAAESVYPLNEANIRRLAERVETLSASLLSETRVFCALIPDKSMLMPQEHGRPVVSYADMERVLTGALSSADYVPLYDLLRADDYYATDIHWRQERLPLVARQLALRMGVSFAEPSYQPRAYAPFYGGYYARQSASLPPDTLVFLESDYTREAVVTNLQKPSVTRAYDTAALSGLDAYDVFLSGATPFVTIRVPAPSPEAKGRTLLLFRDSFGSSLAPLLLPAYETIVLVDLRYLDASLLSSLLPAGKADALFLFSAATANAGSMLR